MTIESSLVEVCNEVGKTISGIRHNDQVVLGGRLMLTIAGLESNFGNLRDFVRSEKAYSPGGKYFNDSDAVRALFRKWGCLATASYGSFQVMFVTARELGFTDHPIKLQEDVTCGYWAGQLIKKRFIERFKAKTLRDILDAYNSGNHKDQYIPTLYIEKGIKIFEDLEGV